MMTIDEVIGYEKICSERSDAFVGYTAEEHRQLAEWLEELKALRHFESNYKHNLNVEYNNAINDFYDEILNFEDYIGPMDTSEFGTVLLYSGNDITKMIYNIKEQLKKDRKSNNSLSSFKIMF